MHRFPRPSRTPRLALIPAVLLAFAALTPLLASPTMATALPGDAAAHRPTGEPYEGQRKQVPDKRADAVVVAESNNAALRTAGEVVGSTWSTLLVKSHPRISDPTVPALRVAVKFAEPPAGSGQVRAAVRLVVENRKETAQSSAALTGVYRLLATIPTAAGQTTVESESVVVRLQRRHGGEWRSFDAAGVRAQWDAQEAVVWVALPQDRLGEAVRLTSGAVRTSVELRGRRVQDRVPLAALNMALNH